MTKKYANSVVEFIRERMIMRRFEQFERIAAVIHSPPLAIVVSDDEVLNLPTINPIDDKTKRELLLNLWGSDAPDLSIDVSDDEVLNG